MQMLILTIRKTKFVACSAKTTPLHPTPTSDRAACSATPPSNPTLDRLLPDSMEENLAHQLFLDGN